MSFEQVFPLLVIIIPIIANFLMVAIGQKYPTASYYIGKFAPAIVAAMKSPREQRLEILLAEARKEIAAVAMGDSPLSAKIEQELGVKK